HDLHELALEQLLDDLLERRQQARVVRRDAALEVVGPLAEAEHAEILVLQRRRALTDDLADLLPLLAARQADPRPAHLQHGLVAADAAEDEEDRRQQMLPLEQLDRLGPVEAPRALRALGRAGSSPPAPARPA